MNKEDYKVYSDKMRKSIDAVNADFASVRAGRANASVLDRISVDYYGSPTPIQQIAAIASPDPRQLVIAHIRVSSSSPRGTARRSSPSSAPFRSLTLASTRRTTASRFA